jgi:hypothetical protein
LLFVAAIRSERERQRERKKERERKRERERETHVLIAQQRIGEDAPGRQDYCASQPAYRPPPPHTPPCYVSQYEKERERKWLTMDL